jgi:hypothetical protein
MNYIKAKLCPKQERMKHELSRLTEVETSLKTDLAEQYIRAADYEADIEELQNFKIDFDKLASENQKTIKSLADEVQKAETLRRKLQHKNNSEEHLIYEVSEKLNIIKALRVELASKSQVILSQSYRLVLLRRMALQSSSRSSVKRSRPAKELKLSLFKTTPRRLTSLRHSNTSSHLKAR